MSFDTEFDYTSAKDFLNTKIAALNTRITECDEEVAALQVLSGYEDLTAGQIAAKQRRCDLLKKDKVTLESALTEIGIVEALEADDKQTLYDLFNVIGEPKRRYMARLLKNTDGLVTDSTVMLADAGLSADSKSRLGRLICQKHPVSREGNEIMGGLR